MKTRIALALLGTCLTLTACGGGGTDETDVTDTAGNGETIGTEADASAAAPAADAAADASMSAAGDPAARSAGAADGVGAAESPAAVGAGMAPGAGSGAEPEGSPGQNEAMRGTAPVGGAAGNGGPAQ